MSRVHYFQRYAQPENVHTNNALLLLSRIQNHDHALLGDVLNELLGDMTTDTAQFEIGVQITQQSVSGTSVPDAVLSQQSFRIVIETKCDSGAFDSSQLSAHLDAFGTETIRLLLMLAPDRASIPIDSRNGIVISSKTFTDLIDACDAAGVRDQLRLREVLDDYEEYCHEFDLISHDDDRMMAVPVSGTIDANVDFGVYYRKSRLSHRPCCVLGLYRDKCIRFVGNVVKIVVAHFDDDRLVLSNDSPRLTEDERSRMREALAYGVKSLHNDFRDVSHEYFFVDRFVETSFAKTSDWGLRGIKYFSLRTELELDRRDPVPAIEVIASRLSGREWS